MGVSVTVYRGEYGMQPLRTPLALTLEKFRTEN